MSNLIPLVGTRGIFTLASPFAVSVLPNVAYTCVAVRELNDIVAAGGDPKTQYYTPRGISDIKYKEDLDLGACIVSLQAGAGSWIYVPSTYITKMPDQNGVPYTSLAIAVTLSAVPDTLDLSYIKQKMQDIVMDNLGVTAVARTIALSPTTLISQTEHAAAETARQSNKTNLKTDYANLLEVTAQRDAALQKIIELENYILSLP